MTREEIISNMCRTWRHDYDLPQTPVFPEVPDITVGMNQEDREFLWKQMAQIFDNDIAPYMDFRVDKPE